MPKKNRIARDRRGNVSETALMILRDEEHLIPEEKRLERWALLRDHQSALAERLTLAESWALCREQILEQWVQDHPGTRPST
jgi:hypothetical protein